MKAKKNDQRILEMPAKANAWFAKHGYNVYGSLSSADVRKDGTFNVTITGVEEDQARDAAKQVAEELGIGNYAFQVYDDEIRIGFRAGEPKSRRTRDGGFFYTIEMKVLFDPDNFMFFGREDHRRTEREEALFDLIEDALVGNEDAWGILVRITKVTEVLR